MRRGSLRQSLSRLTLIATAALCAAVLSTAAPVGSSYFTPGNLVLSRSVYVAPPGAITVGEQLPPVCGSQATCTGKAVSDATYPTVFNNDTVDGSFGITSPIYLDQITTGGQLVNTLAVTDTVLGSQGFNFATSFSSKSELALNLSTDGTVITFMGYNTAVNTLDVSNSNTPGVVDPTNPVGTNVYRVVGQIDINGNITTTLTNAYSGNNGRAAIYAGGVYFTAGNDNNGSQPTTPPYNSVLTALIDATGLQVVTPNAAPGTPLMAGSFPLLAGDKPGKDDNFRGLTVFNNTVYTTKGSGSNGINTVYQLGTAGVLPTGGGAVISVLPGFPTAIARTAGKNNIYPFGIWFANANTLYVADEGDGVKADAGSSPYAGLQKWSLVNGSWTLDYVLQNGLGLGVPYGVSNYPSALNPSTDGLRNITGRVNPDGTVTVWAVTSTVSNSGDQGADPNRLVIISDVLANTDPNVAANEAFGILRTANFGEVLRGISFTPGTTAAAAPGKYNVTASGIVYSRGTHTYSSVLTVTNNGASAVSGPLSVALSGVPQGVSVINTTGTYQGLPAIQVLGSGGTLNPGASVSSTVVLSDPSGVAITFTPSVVNQ